MKTDKIFDSELKLMELVWEREPVTAKELSELAAERIGWNKNTTYTVLKKLTAKEFISREEPNFVCRSLIKREKVRRHETKSLIDRLYGGSRKALFSALLDDGALSREELESLARMIEEKDAKK